MFVPAMVRVESAPLPVFLYRIHVDYFFCGLLEPNFLYDFFAKMLAWFWKSHYLCIRNQRMTP